MPGNHYHPTLLALIGNWMLAGAVVIDLIVYFALSQRGLRLILRNARLWTAVVVFVPTVILSVLPSSTSQGLEQVLFALMSLRVLYLFRILHFIAERKILALCFLHPLSASSCSSCCSSCSFCSSISSFSSSSSSSSLSSTLLLPSSVRSSPTSFVLKKIILPAITRQVVQIGLTLLMLLFISASAIGQSNELAWGSSLYFMIITIATVGYGDITPSNSLTRVLVCLTILIGFILVPIEATVLGSMISSKHSYDGKLGRRIRGSHVVFLGQAASSRVLQMMDEFFHSDRGVIGTSFAVVALTPSEPPRELLRLSLASHTRGQFRVFRGLPSRDSDLQRIQTADARAAFVLSPDPPMSATAADKDAVLRALAVRRVAPSLSLIVQLVLPTYRSFLPSDVEVVCEQELFAGLLARSVQCPGLPVLIAGLLGTSHNDLVDSSSRQARMPWLREFSFSEGHELYHAFLASHFAGWRFGALVTHLLSEYGVLLIGIESRVPRVVTLQPGAQYEFQGDEVVFLIAPDKRTVNKILYVCEKYSVCYFFLLLLSPSFFFFFFLLHLASYFFFFFFF
jgi:hypothetical protein